jgi:hypothetical protein
VFKVTLADIWREKITCIIHTSTQEEADMLFKAVDSYDHNGTTWASWWNVYKKKTCYRTNLGEVVAYGCIDNYIEDGEKVIEFSDLVATGGYCNGFRGGKIPTPSKPVSIEEQFGLPKGVSIHDLPIESLYRPMNIEIQPLELVCNEEQAKNIAERLAKELNGMLGVSFTKKEEKKMPTKFTFYVKEGTRVDKTCNKLIPTMTTFITAESYGDSTYHGAATCDKADYDERQGCLEAIANAVLGGNFDRDFNRAVKANELADKKKRTCTYCGQLFDTVEEKQAHEAWHVERRKARHERYLLRKRAKEIAFEEQAQKMAKEIIAEDNKK